MTINVESTGRGAELATLKRLGFSSASVDPFRDVCIS
jgi:hypothetical protein